MQLFIIVPIRNKFVLFFSEFMYLLTSFFADFFLNHLLHFVWFERIRDETKFILDEEVMTVLSYRELLHTYVYSYVLYVQVCESGYLIAKGSKEKKFEITNKYYGLLTMNISNQNAVVIFESKDLFILAKTENHKTRNNIQLRSKVNN